jgi:hypothetical protein
MSRRVALLVLLIVVVLVGGAVGIMVSARPALEDRRDVVDARWTPLRGPLTGRYDALNQVAVALVDAGAAERSYTVALNEELDTWRRLAGSQDTDPRAEASAANRLEGLASRVRANFAYSARLGSNDGIRSAFEAYDLAVVPSTEIRQFNRSVREYEDARTETLKRVPASLFGFDAMPLLVIGG